MAQVDLKGENFTTIKKDTVFVTQIYPRPGSSLGMIQNGTLKRELFQQLNGMWKTFDE